MRRLVIPALLTVALAATGCGGGKQSDEVVLGSGEGRAQRQDERIASLERRLRERKAQAQEARVSNPAQDRSGGGGLVDGSAGQSFSQLESSLGGQIGVTIGRVGDPESEAFGSLSGGEAWSTIKLAIAAEVLADAGGPSGLDGADGDLIRRALTASDNAAAAQLFEQLKARHGGLDGAAQAVGEALRAAGDTSTVVSTQGRDGFSPYGQTNWSLADQHRFISRLAAACIPDTASAQYILQLMGQVVSDQRWGMGSAGVPARFKGGWGPGVDGGYLVRQAGVLELDGAAHPVVVTMAALPADGQFGTGQQMLTEVANWVVEHVDRSEATSPGC